MILGGRLTTWETRGDNFGTPQNARYKNEFVPYSGLTYDINRDLSVYTSYTEIFNPENRRDRNNIIGPGEWAELRSRFERCCLR